MCDLWQLSCTLPFCCNKYNIVVSSSSGGAYLDQAAGGGEAISLATSLDLRLFGYLHERRCCICRNFAQNQLQPLVEPQPSQT